MMKACFLNLTQIQMHAGRAHHRRAQRVNGDQLRMLDEGGQSLLAVLERKKSCYISL